MPFFSDTFALVEAMHFGQTDKAGAPYMRHLVAVMAGAVVAAHVHGLDAIAVEHIAHAAILHDIIEDTGTTAGDLRSLGYSPKVVDTVLALTKPPSRPYLDFIQSIVDSGDRAAILVKIADLEDNSDPRRLARLVPELAERLAHKYAVPLAKLRAALGGVA